MPVNQTPNQPAVSKLQISRRPVAGHHSLFSQLVSVQAIGMLAILGGLLVPLTGCGIIPQAEAEAQTRRPGGERGKKANNVDVAIARTGSLREAPEYIGTTYPQRQVSFRSQAEGKLLNLNVDVGSPVTRGQILAQLDDTILLTAVTQAEAELASRESEVARARTVVSNARTKVEQARLQLQQSQNDAARLQQLLRAGAIPKQQAEQAQTTAATAAQNLRAAQEQVATEQQAVVAAQSRVLAQRAVIAQARERQSYALLSSPITGIVVEKVTEPGNLVQPGGEILRIGDFNRVKVVVQVSELELSNIRVGQSAPVVLDAFPNQELIGQITLISPVADPQARLVPVEVSIPNSNGRIGSGLLARVKFITPTSEKVIIPQSALQAAGRRGRGAEGERGSRAGGAGLEENGSRKQTTFNQNAPSSPKQETVFVVGEGRQAKVAARSVTVGDRANNQVEILSGLQPGERFVTRSSKPLKDGASVRLSVLSETTKPAGNRNAQQ